MNRYNMAVVSKGIKENMLGKVKPDEKVMDLARQYEISDKPIYYWLRQSIGEQIVTIVQYNKVQIEKEDIKTCSLINYS